MIPLPVYLALCLLALISACSVVLLILAFTYHPYPNAPVSDYNDDDAEMPDTIPAYPHPPVLVTRWGIHRNHVSRGHDTERGCVVCYDLGLHLTPLNPRISRRPE